MMGTAVNYGLCRIENESKRKWMHMGDNGVGAIMALCINLVLGLTRMALGEWLNCPLPLISLQAQALSSELSKGRGEWDSADIISFYDGRAAYSAPKTPTGSVQ